MEEAVARESDETEACDVPERNRGKYVVIDAYSDLRISVYKCSRQCEVSRQTLRADSHGLDESKERLGGCALVGRSLITLWSDTRRLPNPILTCARDPR